MEHSRYYCDETLCRFLNLIANVLPKALYTLNKALHDCNVKGIFAFGKSKKFKSKNLAVIFKFLNIF